jgi:hypothetical protein
MMMQSGQMRLQDWQLLSFVLKFYKIGSAPQK